MMKILQVIEATTGGTARHVIDLCGALLDKGHEVSLIYSPIRASAEFEQMAASYPFHRVASLPMRRSVGPWDMAAAWRLRRLVKDWGPFDILHAHSSKAGALARMIFPKQAARIYTPHAFRTMDPSTGAVERMVYGVIEGALGRFFSEAIIAVSPEEADHAIEMGLRPQKIHTVVNGLSAKPVVDREAVRSRLGIGEDDIVVGFVGRLCEQKDPLRFAKAVRLANMKNSRVRGVMLGDGELCAAAAEAGGGALSIHSGLNGRNHMPAFDVFAMTSLYEAMPYVLLEAHQAGLPIISTRVGGTSVTIRHDRDGKLLEVNATPEVIAQAWLDWIASDRPKRGAPSQNEEISVNRMADETENVYRSSRVNRL
ncbi:glycosyltransferase [Brevundimonas nasdae]|uniref:glycosyltransferase n=1 Tax=Brevundimonas nasdae TaxID=172043 RepID=UPI0028A2526F|nr:glycosyltransferase [Brevundimonas nasdae]